MYQSNQNIDKDISIGVIIPCYRVRNMIIDVLKNIGSIVDKIYLIDDCCPEGSGKFVESTYNDERINIIYHKANLGVGGAVKTGYRQALNDGCTIIVKLDGDGQMDPKLIEKIIKPIVDGAADYSKGNRFFDLASIKSMPRLRLFGNSVLSLFNKFVCGYWNIMDPTNGYTAIHKSALLRLPLEKIENRFFFESDMLFRLSLYKAVIWELPMDAVYAGEISNLKISKVLIDFPFKYLTRFLKRVFYMYFLREFNVGTLQIVTGTALFMFGLIFGLVKWINSILTGIPATSGTVMLSSLPLILGFQLLLSAIFYDMQNVPSAPIQKYD